jgi:hypothetical protein
MRKYLQNLNVNHLAAVFLASMLGSLSLTALLNSATEPGAPLALETRIALTLVAVLVYATIVWLTFYLIVPEYRPALRRIIGGQK